MSMLNPQLFKNGLGNSNSFKEIKFAHNDFEFWLCHCAQTQILSWPISMYQISGSKWKFIR